MPPGRRRTLIRRGTAAGPVAVQAIRPSAPPGCTTNRAAKDERLEPSESKGSGRPKGGPRSVPCEPLVRPDREMRARRTDPPGAPPFETVPECPVPEDEHRALRRASSTNQPRPRSVDTPRCRRCCPPTGILGPDYPEAQVPLPSYRESDRQAAESTAAALATCSSVVLRPSDKRTDSRATSGARPIASRTAEGASLPA